MNQLPNLDHYDDLERGQHQADQPEPVKPHATRTAAKCLLPLMAIPGVFTGDRLEATR